jgi:hypothetical protein
MPTAADATNAPWTFEMAGWKAVLAGVVNIAGFVVVLAYDDAESVVGVIGIVCMALALLPLQKLLSQFGNPATAIGAYIAGNGAWVALDTFKPTHPPALATAWAIGGPLVGGVWLGGLFALQARALPKGARLLAGLLLISSLCFLPVQVADLAAHFDVDQIAARWGQGPAVALGLAAITAFVAQTWMYFSLARIYFKVQPEHVKRVALVDAVKP